jgi:hypothetical protein
MIYEFPLVPGSNPGGPTSLISFVFPPVPRIKLMICSYRLDKETHMAVEKKDESVLGHINQLVKEEERLYAQTELTTGDRERLAALKVELDQYWDLLRQRRALREFGSDPDKASVRPAKIVENYEQ